jgi:hypothetical protein
MPAPAVEQFQQMPEGYLPPGARVVDEVEVFDTEGKPHKMRRLNANDMVQHLGWYWKVPKIVEGPGRVVVLSSKKNAPVAKEDQVETDLTAMTADELRVFAKAEFDMEFPEGASHKDMLDDILLEQADKATA